MSDFLPERQSSAHSQPYITTQQDEVALYDIRGIKPSAILPPASNNPRYARFEYERSAAFETVHEEWTSARTVNADLRAFISARKRYYGLSLALSRESGR